MSYLFIIYFFAPVAILEAIRMLLMKEVYVKTTSRIWKFDFLRHVYKLKKSLYGLKQTPKAAPVAILEAIRMLLMEEVYVKTTSRIWKFDFLRHVYKLKKSLYGLKQTPKAWYDRFSNFLTGNDFKMGKPDTTFIY